jgi:hypothetical protein
MKTLIYLLTILIIVSSCATTNEGKTTVDESSGEMKPADPELIKYAVESRRFIIKFDKCYPMGGGMIDLYPKRNYIVIEGEKALLSVAYFGRQYYSRAIAGFNMKGRTLNYQAIQKSSGGLYNIKMKLGNEKNSFDIDLKIDKNGECTASVSNARTDYSRYRGYIVPIQPSQQPDLYQQPDKPQKPDESNQPQPEIIGPLLVI